MGLTNKHWFIVGSAINILGAGLTLVGSEIVGIVLIVIGLTGLGYVGFQAIKIKTSEIIFYDDFSKLDGWEQILEGKVIQSDEQYHSGSSSLKKKEYNDPNGAYKLIGKTIKPGFCFSGWIYRPKEFKGGPADRLSIEDSKGNGYGFSVRHEKVNALFFIEKRGNSLPCGTFLPGGQLNIDGGLTNEWYHFEFIILSNGKISFRINLKGKPIIQIDTNPKIDAKYKRYDTFHRIAIHGGHEYFIDDLKIIKL